MGRKRVNPADKKIPVTIYLPTYKVAKLQSNNININQLVNKLVKNFLDGKKL